MTETGPWPEVRVDAALGWTPPPHWRRVDVIDAHTGGEPLRVALRGFPAPRGATMLARRADARARLDGWRRALVLEPRGHADMYAALPTPAATPDGDLGVLFLHNAGWSTMCGHGVVALTKVVLDLGLLVRSGDAPVLRLDTPAGRVVATGHRGRAGMVEAVSFENVPSFLCRRDGVAQVPALADVLGADARVRYDLAYGGAFYAYVDAAEVGLRLEPSEHDEIVRRAVAIHHAVAADPALRHPSGDPELEFLYGVILVRRDVPGVESRSVCVFAEGEVDRSPTGTGVSGRAAALHARGELPVGRTITIESLVGTRFDVRVEREVDERGVPAVVPWVRGAAWTTGRAALWVDPDDPLGAGFLLRAGGA